MNDRSDTDEPIWTKSKTDRALPKRHIPYTDTVDPIRPKPLKDNEEPMVM
jgi:hypothetical protein